MSLLAAERIKLGTTRSPYWCVVAIVVAALGFALIVALNQDGLAATTSSAALGVNLGLSIFMVLAALSVTTEYRFNTIRTTFLAAPRRIAVLVAKSVLIGVLGLVVGALMGLAAFLLARALVAGDPGQRFPMSSVDDWRQIVGWGPLFALGGVLAVAVGILVRQSAGAVAIVLLWPLLIENLIGLIPGFGDTVRPYLPFRAANQFVASGTDLDPSPLASLGIFAAWTVAIWLVAAAVLRSRDT